MLTGLPAIMAACRKEALDIYGGREQKRWADRGRVSIGPVLLQYLNTQNTKKLQAVIVAIPRLYQKSHWHVAGRSASRLSVNNGGATCEIVPWDSGIAKPESEIRSGATGCMYQLSTGNHCRVI